MSKRRARPKQWVYEDGCLIEALDELKATATRKHGTLRRIEVLGIENPLCKVPVEDMLKHFGFNLDHWIKWNIGDGTGYTSSGLPVAGSSHFFRDEIGRFHSFITIVGPTVAEDTPEHRQRRAAVNIGILAHELGHVQDFENRINFDPGKPLDIMKAELYADHYACRLMSKYNLRVPLEYWLLQAIEQKATCESAAIREAANLLKASPDYIEYARRALI